ncbi:MAG: bifunctional homocysteine S-methyltransferase/methylenetetrahydrofolate reductase [Lachnospiraceae bacterium]
MTARKMMDLRQYLSEKKLIADGAFGTYYSEKYSTVEAPELACLYRPERVVEVHSEYIAAGAGLLRTNTFSAYEDVLGSSVDVKKLRKNAVSLAFRAAEEARKKGCTRKIYVAGDIGPAPFDVNNRDNIQTYREIAGDLCEAGCDLLVFETFPDMEEIYPVIKELKTAQPELFILVQFAVNQYGYSSTGCSAGKLLQHAFECPEIDAVGLNCGIGPAHMATVIKKIEPVKGKFLSAFPNAGYPKLVRDRIIYSDNPVYFAERMKDVAEYGADILGGCCGTEPDNIREMGKVIDLANTEKNSVLISTGESCPKGRNEAFYAGKESGKKLIAVELVPPLNAEDESLISSAGYLKSLGVDVLTFPDSPSGRTRVDSILMAKKVAEETGMCVMPHISCRDKNAIAMRSQIMGAYINDIYNLLIVTGDPVPAMERGQIKSVFNFDAVRLMSMVDDMNSEFFAKAPFTYGGAVNQGRRNIENEIVRVKKKMEKGAGFFMSQPVFSQKDADNLRRIKAETGARLLCGIMPLISRKNALFMKNEISGIGIDDAIVELFPEGATRQQGEEIGVALAKKAMEMCEDFTDGYYFSFPFNRVYLLEKLVNNSGNKME